jgi:hypothetical protein
MHGISKGKRQLEKGDKKFDGANAAYMGPVVYGGVSG